MNPVVAQTIRKCLCCIGDSTFDEVHIKSLLVDLRQYVPPQSILREIAHFVAHPDERDRRWDVAWSYRGCICWKFEDLAPPMEDEIP